MKLSQLLRDIQIKTPYEDVEISSLTDDSRKIISGGVFVCIKGAKFDGHDAAQQALDMGVAAIVTQRDLGLERQIVVDDTRKAYSLMCAAYFGHPAEKLRLIGVTGTNGKTTTTFLLKSILEYAGEKVGLIGTVKNMICETEYDAQYTTPDAYELQSLFAKMVEAECKFCVMEVSSQALAQGRVAGLHFEIAGFTNLTQDHLDYHKDFAGYAEAKHILFEHADTAVLNLDDEASPFMVKDTNCKEITYSVYKDQADYTAKNVNHKPTGVEYELVGNGVIGRVRLGIPGGFTVYNSMCAAVCAIAAGIPFQTVLQGVSAAKGVAGRVEVVPTNTDYTVIVDYAHTPDGIRNILNALRIIAKGRVIAVFGCGGDRDHAKRPIMGGIAAELSDVAIVTVDNPRSEDPNAIIADILDGMVDAKIPVCSYNNRVEAIRYALSIAQKDDVIVITGKGHEDYQLIKGVKIHYNDSETVLAILEEQKK